MQWDYGEDNMIVVIMKMMSELLLYNTIQSFKLFVANVGGRFWLATITNAMEAIVVIGSPISISSSGTTSVALIVKINGLLSPTIAFNSNPDTLTANWPLVLFNEK